MRITDYDSLVHLGSGRERLFEIYMVKLDSS